MQSAKCEMQNAKCRIGTIFAGAGHRSLASRAIPYGLVVFCLLRYSRFVWFGCVGE